MEIAAVLSVCCAVLCCAGDALRSVCVADCKDDAPFFFLNGRYLNARGIDVTDDILYSHS